MEFFLKGPYSLAPKERHVQKEGHVQKKRVMVAHLGCVLCLKGVMTVLL